MIYSIYHNEQKAIENITKADNFFSRFKGLMFKKAMDKNCGLLIAPCGQVHTFNMRFDIDVVFLSKEFEVLHIESSMKPRKVSKIIANSYYVLELCSGIANEKQIKKGDVLSLKEKKDVGIS